LSSRYDGPLYQVQRADGRLLNIGVIASGFALVASRLANGAHGCSCSAEA